MIKVEIGKARKPSKLGKNHLLGLTNKLRKSLNQPSTLQKAEDGIIHCRIIGHGRISVSELRGLHGSKVKDI